MHFRRLDTERQRDIDQFVHFPFTDAQVAAMKQPGAKVTVGLNHPNYTHAAELPEAVRAELAGDFD